MNAQRQDTQDWVIPALVVGLSFVLLFVVGLVVAVSRDQRADAAPLIVDLDGYTECLIDYGADVPRVVVGRDGGFSVIVSGSLAAGDLDPDSWQPAANECSDVAPDILGDLVGGLFGGWLDNVPAGAWGSLGWLDAIPGGRGDVDLWRRFRGVAPGPANPSHGRHSPRRRDFRRRCERLETAGDAATGPWIERLRRHCERLDR